jgi:hypothetical protein
MNNHLRWAFILKEKKRTNKARPKFYRQQTINISKALSELKQGAPFAWATYGQYRVKIVEGVESLPCTHPFDKNGDFAPFTSFYVVKARHKLFIIRDWEPSSSYDLYYDILTEHKVQYPNRVATVTEIYNRT